MSQIEEQRLITKIASLYYEEGLKQSEISAQLDLSQSFISRALRRALQEGVVKITVMRLQGLHLELETQLQRRYGVRRVIVVEATEPGNDESIKQAQHVFGVVVAAVAQQLRGFQVADADNRQGDAVKALQHLLDLFHFDDALLAFHRLLDAL